MTRKAFGLALAALAFVSAVAYAGVPVTGEIPVNTSTVDDQVDSDVAMAANGTFAVVWEDQDGDDIDGRLFNPAGLPLTPEIDGDVDGNDPAIAANDAASLAAVSYERDGEIYVSLLSAITGSGAEIPVSTTATDSQDNPDVAMDATGNFVVVWTDETQLLPRVLGRLFDSSGTPTSAELPLSVADQEAAQPEVAMDADGDFVAVWQTDDGDQDGIEARVFNEAGVPQTGEIAVPPGTAGDQDDPDVAMDASGNFVAVWETGEDAGQDVVGRRFSAAGAPTTGQFPLATTTAEEQNGPKVAVSDAGDQIIVGWDNNGPGDDEGVFHRRFTAAGTPATPEGRVNVTTAGDQEEHAVAADAAGNYVFTWEMDDGDEEGIFARRFDIPGPPGPPGPPGGPTGDIASLGKIAANGKRVVVNVTCLAAVCNFTGAARVIVPNKALKKAKKKKAKASKAFKLKQASASLTQGQSGKLTIRLNKKAKKAAKKAFKKKRFRKKVRAKLDLDVTDNAGRSQDLGTPKVKVKPPKLKKKKRRK